jgi:23S rRNA (pseudouridine1915-N3)-methyltransferase
MRILLLAIGKIKTGPTLDLFDIYKKRLKTPLTVLEYDSKSPKGLQQETDFLLTSLPPSSYVIALDERGRSLDSQAFAHKMDEVRTHAHKTLCFMIGGPDGLADAVRTRADLVISLGTMTWPHMLVRVLLAEQLYRAESILNNHPYHRD